LPPGGRAREGALAGAPAPGERGLEPVVAPEELALAHEARRPEDAEGLRLLALRAKLRLGRLAPRCLEDRARRAAGPLEARRDHGRLGDLPFPRAARLVDGAHEAREPG